MGRSRLCSRFLCTTTWQTRWGWACGLHWKLCGTLNFGSYHTAELNVKQCSCLIVQTVFIKNVECSEHCPSDLNCKRRADMKWHPQQQHCLGGQEYVRCAVCGFVCLPEGGHVIQQNKHQFWTLRYCYMLNNHAWMVSVQTLFTLWLVQTSHCDICICKIVCLT
jgi:hypothetical protein